jgi:hypothetical protein
MLAGQGQYVCTACISESAYEGRVQFVAHTQEQGFKEGARFPSSAPKGSQHCGAQSGTHGFDLGYGFQQLDIVVVHKNPGTCGNPEIHRWPDPK